MPRPRKHWSAILPGYGKPFFPEELADLNEIVLKKIIKKDCLPEGLTIFYEYDGCDYPIITNDGHEWYFVLKANEMFGNFLILFPSIKLRPGTKERFLPRSIAVYKKGEIRFLDIAEIIKKLTNKMTF